MGSNPPSSTTKLTRLGIRAKRARKAELKRMSGQWYAGLAKERAEARKILMRKQRGLCFYCQHTVLETWRGTDDHNPTLDHVIPKRDGGGNGLDNLVIACRKCNSDKGGLSSSEFEFIKAFRRRYWPTRLVMSDMQEDLLGHLNVRSDGLWYKPGPGEPEVLPRSWKSGM